VNALTSKERLDCCYRHKELDRPGLCFRGITPKTPSHPSFEALRELAMIHTDVKLRWDCRSLVEPPRMTFETEAVSDDFERHVTIIHTPGGNLRTSFMAGLRGQQGMREEFLLKTPEDAHKYLSQAEPRVGGDISPFFRLQEKLGRRGIVELPLGLNPAGFVVELFGAAQFGMFSIEHRDILHALMKRRMNHLLALIKFLLQAGAGPYFSILGQEHVTPPLYSVYDYRDFSVRYDRAIASLIHESGGCLHVHCPGPIREVLPCFVETGVDVLHPVESPPLGDVTARSAKKAFRNHICIEGNIAVADLFSESVETIRARTTALIEDAFSDRRNLIVCPTASPHTAEMTPRGYENYAAMVDVVTNWKP